MIDNTQQETTANKQVNAQTNTKIDRLAALNAIKNKFTSTIIKIYINSIGREVSFREINVAEQKKLARIMIDNENRKDIVYDTQCAVLQQICLEDDFDIYSLTEFDKIKLLLLLYQRNMTKHDISFVCTECHTENKYQIDFSTAIDKLDKFVITDQTYHYENQSWIFDFILAYPSVSKVSKFYQSRYLNHKRVTDKNALESLNTTTNVDYTNLFIKGVTFTDKSTNEVTTIDFNDYTLNEMFELISVFPQDVLYAENGIIQYITQQFITKINDAFDKHECVVCGKLCETAADSSADGFF